IADYLWNLRVPACAARLPHCRSWTMRTPPMDLQRIASGTPHPLTLRVGVFFDGTGNNLGNGMHAGASPERGGSYANAPSNVALLYGLYPVGAVEAFADRVFFKVY